MEMVAGARFGKYLLRFPTSGVSSANSGIAGAEPATFHPSMPASEPR